MNELQIPGKSVNGFILTQEFKRFEEFAIACTDFRYIGICHGDPGVGKSLAASYYMQWKEELIHESAIDELSPEKKIIIEKCKGVLLTVPVINTPKIMKTEIGRRSFGYGLTLIKSKYGTNLNETIKEAFTACPLVMVDEADRLNINSLEEVRSQYDQFQFGLILIGMPGIEKRFSRYPQLYSRIGFCHEFKSLTEDEMRFRLPNIWENLGFSYNSDYYSDVEALNTIIRITGGNFRLIDRLFSQIIRLIKVNQLTCINKEVVEAARKCLLMS